MSGSTSDPEYPIVVYKHAKTQQTRIKFGIWALHQICRCT